MLCQLLMKYRVGTLVLAVAATAPLIVAALKFTPPANIAPAKVQQNDVNSGTLLGLWQAFRPEKHGDPVRFYYFHSGGIGLVRYGRLGLTYTRSFGWKVAGDHLMLVFTKTGAHHRVKFSLEEDRAVLHLPSDPAFPGDHRYRKETRPRGLELDGRQAMPSSPEAANHPLARLWQQTTQDKSGHKGFRMYQFQAPTIDGRGVGWYHEGDMDEWSTEALVYRAVPNASEGGKPSQLELHFTLRGERSTTVMQVIPEDKTKAKIVINEDPRNYWHTRTYVDEGPSFTVALEGELIPFHPMHFARRQGQATFGCQFAH